jgi:3-hydroxybutyryl-CoA dehydrogenase
MTAAELPANAAVLGAGTIGLSAGIHFAAHGIPVTLVSRRADAAAETPAAADRRLARLRDLGALSDDGVRTARGNLHASVGLPDGESFSLIYEAVGERLEDKRAVLAGAEPSVSGEGVLVSTTSSLPVAELAEALVAPERFAAWHWFHPADLMGLVEIVPGPRTSAAVVETLQRWSVALGKQAIVLRRDAPGFVANRLQYALLREAYALVQDGVCDPAAVDVAVTAGLGARWAAIGPFATMDLAGLAVHAAVAEALLPDLSDAKGMPEMLSRLRASGAGGARTGRGLLGEYGPERLTELEARRARTLVALRDGFDER